jgi:hypothetical protein
MVEDCSGNNQSWRTICLMEQDDMEALEAEAWLAAFLVEVLVELV